MSTSTRTTWGSPVTAAAGTSPQESGVKLLLTVVEAAERLSIGRTLMYELLCSGQIESIHVGRLHRIPTEALTDFVDRQRVHGQPA